jgi:hypothetical protein
MSGDSLRDLAVVEAFRPLGADSFERVRELGHPETLADPESPARPVEGISLRRMAQQRIEDLVEIRTRLVEDCTVPGEPSSGREQLRPGHRSPAAVSLPQPEPRPRHGDRCRAGVEDLLGVAEVHDELEELVGRGRLPRHRHEEVEKVRPGVAGEMDEEEASPAEAGKRALADPGDGRRRDARVDRVATCAENIRSRPGGERMTGC